MYVNRTGITTGLRLFLNDIFKFAIMKNRFYSLFLVTCALTLAGCQTTPQRGDFSAVESGFVQPPADVQTSAYWYWINDNISKEAVVKDLHAMKEGGINRAFIGNIGLPAEDQPYGKVQLFTDEWWEVMHTALKTATALDIELGIFNCPGWSQSGGPWIKPEQAMRYLASSEIRVQGPQKLSRKLEQPTQDFQDVKVVAWPVAADYGRNLLDDAVQIRMSSAAANDNAPGAFARKTDLSSGHTELTLMRPETTLDITFSQKTTARSLVVYTSHRRTFAEGDLQVKEGNDYRSVKKFTVNRTNPSLNVGFDPYAPIAISFPETTAQDFRIVFSNVMPNSGIAQIILSSTPIVERYAEKSLAKMFQNPLPYWHDYLWDQQAEVKDPSLIPSPDKVQDISQFLAADGTLTWDVPAGEWIIMRTGMAPTGVTNSPASAQGTGLEVDKMNKQHVSDHFYAFLGQILERVPEADRKTWKVIVEDSYETGGQNFTDGMLEEFQQRYGYDPVPFLPVYQGHTIGSPDLSDRFLWDVRRLVADKVAYDYVAGLRDVGHKHGLTTWLENYGHWGFPAEFLQYGGQSDEIGGEFWSEGELGNIENRAASSCAHIYGKTKVSAESFTCGGNAYSRHPGSMKRRGDWSFTEGINNTLLHVYIQQPYEDRHPGVNVLFGNEFNRMNTWFPQIDLFTTYLKRCNFMLQQGLNVADVAYFIGEDAPKMTGIRDPELPKGYSFDYINAEVIERDLTVKDGRLILPHGTSYSLLVLPKLETMRPELLQKIEQLVADGAVILGPPPSRSPSMQNYPEADRQVQAMASKMWGDLSTKQRAYGKGLILTDMDMQEALDLLKVAPDCRFDDTDPMLYVHRTVAGNEVYFITNQSEHTIQINPRFRVNGMVPELWDAVTGAIRSLPAYIQKDGITTVPMQLESLESAFVVFRKSGAPRASRLADNYPQLTSLAEASTPWQVTFQSDEIRRGPAETVPFYLLEDWTKSSDECIRYFSGAAVYKNNITVKEIPAGQKIYIDLGKVHVMAKVKVNGQYAGGAWTAPYRVDVTPFVRQGDNAIEIEVVNNWMNRLIGDLRLPENERRTSSHINPWNAETPLQPSGIEGPIRLVTDFATAVQAKRQDAWQEDFRHQPLAVRPRIEVAYDGFKRDKFRIDAQDYRLIGELNAPHRLVEERNGNPWLWMEVTDEQGKRYSTLSFQKESRINLYRRGAYYCEIHWFDLMPVAADNTASNLVADLALFCYPEKILAEVTWHAKEDFAGARLLIRGIAPKEFDLKPFKKGDIQSFAFPLFGEQPPLPDEAFTLLEGTAPVKYDPVRGCYRVGTSEKGDFQKKFYDTPNLYETASFQVANDAQSRKIYICHESVVSVAGGVVTDESGNPLPLLVQVSKNFSGEKEEPFYNPTDIPFSETIFPLYLSPNEGRTLSSLHLHQNWGRHMTKHFSSLGAGMDYFHSATGVTETTCYVPFKYGGIKGISIADYRAMSQQFFWVGQPQHDNVAGHSFLSYFTQDWQFPEYVRTLYRSTGANWYDIGLEYRTTDGRIRATVDAWESPQTDELRSYFRVRYEVLEPVEVVNATTDFRLLTINSRVQSLRYTHFGATGVAPVQLDAHDPPFPVTGVPLPADKFHLTLYGDHKGSNSMVINRFSAPFSPAATVQYGPYKQSAAFEEHARDAALCLVPNQQTVSLKKGDVIEIEGYWFCYGDSTTTFPVDQCVRDYCDNAPRITQTTKCSEVKNKPTLWIQAEQGKAEFTVTGGRNLIPVVVTGLNDYRYARMQIFEDGKWQEVGHNRNTATDGYQTFCAEDGSFGAVFLVASGQGDHRLRVSTESAPAPSSKITLKTSANLDEPYLVEASNGIASARLHLPGLTRTAAGDESVAPVWNQSEGSSQFFTQQLSTWQRGGRLSPNQEDIDLEYWWQNREIQPAHTQPVFDLEPATDKLLKGKYQALTSEGWQEVGDGEKITGTVYAAGIFASGSCAVIAYRNTAGLSRTGAKLQLFLESPEVAPKYRYHRRGKLYLTALDPATLQQKIMNDLY